MYLPTTTDLSKYWVGDLEGNDLLPGLTTLYVGVFIRGSSNEIHVCRSHEELYTFVEVERLKGQKFVFHNALGYDVPGLNRILGTHLKISDVVDTQVMSLLYSPSLSGGHSLAAWGVRLGFPKTAHKDFSKYTQEMEDYCINDTRLGKKVFLTLIARMTAAGFTNDGIELEHRAWSLIKRQQSNGFAFNVQEAHILESTLQTRLQGLTERIYKLWPPELLLIRSYKKAKKKDGSYTKDYLRHVEQYPRVVLRNDESYDVYDYVAFNIGSPQQRVEKLLALGWVPGPDELTKAGQPSPTKKGQLVPSLVAFAEESGKEEISLIANWIDTNARALMINTWIEAYDERTRCIHGSLWLANTLRYTHSEPNTANIPGVRSGPDGPLMGEAGVWTYEARNLWTTRDPRNRCMVGVDAKGIQLRVLAHYLNNPEFIREVIDGDPHAYNQEIGGFRTRSIAKTFIYAFLLGAGDAKVGQIIGGTPREGRATKDRFVSNFPGLDSLLTDLGRQVDRVGRIVLCDGTPILVKSPHTRLGYLLQGDENRIMKRAAVIADRLIRQRELDVLKVGDIHDEWQNDVLRRHAEEFAYEVCPIAFAKAGEYYRYRLPIECDAKIGLTWAETH